MGTVNWYLIFLQLLGNQTDWLNDILKAGFSNLSSGVKVNILADSRWRMELRALEKVAGILMSRECLK